MLLLLNTQIGRSSIRTSGRKARADAAPEPPLSRAYGKNGSLAHAAGTTRACSAFTRPHAHMAASAQAGAVHAAPGGTVTHAAATKTYF